MIRSIPLKRSLAQFRSHLLRTILTLLGIVFGVGSLVAMVSIGEGTKEEITAMIESMGTNVTHIKPKEVNSEKIDDMINQTVGLSISDVVSLESDLKQIKKIGYRAKLKINVTNLDIATHDMKVFGVNSEFFAVHGLKIAKGRSLLDVDYDNLRRVAVIGPNIAKKVSLGGVIRLDYTYFEVVGILTKRNNPGEDLPVNPSIYNDAILIPYDSAIEELSRPKIYNQLDLISAEVASTEETLQLKELLIPHLKILHGGNLDFEIIAPEEILQKKQAAQSVLNMVFIAISIISLIVGGIGVMNIMLANIIERISEIGLRRALGARRFDILAQFLTESVLTCLIGGFIGIVLGFLASFLVTRIVDIPIAFSIWSVIIAFATAIIIGVTFGLFPAIKAANTNPVQALENK